MSDLEIAIAEWRQQMLSSGITTPVPLEELESHLREDIARQMKLGLSGQTGFQNAVQRLGDAGQLKTEFGKVETQNWNLPLVWAAWLSFIVSLLLPAFMDLRGWKCACLSALAWRGLGLDLSANIHVALLTPANLLMLASPFLLRRFSSPRSLKWLRFSIFAALILVWLFVFRCFPNGGWRDLKIGCYLWATSFLLLCLSTFRTGSRAEYVIKS